MHDYFKSDKITYVLSKNLLEKYRLCVKSINANSTIKKMLAPNIFEEKQFLNEIAFFSDIEVQLPDKQKIIIKFKAKLDSVIIDPETKTIYLNDVKTTSKGVDYFMDAEITDDYGNSKIYMGTYTKLDYYVQMSAYMFLLQLYCREVLKLYDYNYKCNMWVVETTNQYKCKNFPIAQRYCELGRDKFRELLIRLAFHELNGYDKKFEDGIQYEKN